MRRYFARWHIIKLSLNAPYRDIVAFFGGRLESLVRRRFDVFPDDLCKPALKRGVILIPREFEIFGKKSVRVGL